MKTVRPVTKNEETHICDWCGNHMNFPTATCFECGKDACNESCWYTHLREYKGGWPARIEINTSYGQHGTGHQVPNLFFCLECDQTSKVAALCRHLESLLTEFQKQFSTYRDDHYAIAGKLIRMVEEKEIKP